MRFARVIAPDFVEPMWAQIVDGSVELLKAAPFNGVVASGGAVTLSDVTLLAPVTPSKVVCVGKNYADHAAEMGGEVPPEPVIFIKPSTTVIGPGVAIELPSQSVNVHHECELAVVIGAKCREVDVADIDSYIFGYTVANDVTARDLQNSDGQWTRAKSFDTFCPIGPWIETEIDATHLDISCTVNGEVRQHGNTKDLVRNAHEMVSWISQVMTLLPGDVVLTGTPAGVGPIVAGDSVTVAIQSIGELTNPVVLR